MLTRTAGYRTGVLVGVAGLLIAVFSLVGWVLGDRTSAAELRLMRHLDSGPHAVLTIISKVLSTIGSASVLATFAVVVALLLALRGRVSLALVIAVSTLGGIVLSDIVKVIVDRNRPAIRHLVSVSSQSFPSGHSTQAAAIVPALALAAIACGLGRGIAVSLAVVIVLAIGISRVLLGVHYPTDVVAGWLLGSVWFAAVTVAIRSDRWLVRDRPSAPDAGPNT